MTEPARRHDDLADSAADGAAGTASAERQGGAAQDSEARGGEAACWAHLVCPDCGAITSEGHQPGCSLAAPAGPFW